MANLIDDLRFLVGAGFGVGPSRITRHPRRDDEGHDTGNKVDATDTTDDDGDQNETGDVDADAGNADDDSSKDAAHWKAMARKNEREAKANRAAAAELEKLKQAQMTDAEKQAATTKATEERAAAAEAKAAVLEAALEHGITDKKDLELLEGLPADKVAAFAKRLAAQKAPAGRSGNPVDGEKPKPKPTTLTGAIGAHYA
ncbi:hypothetical protein [Prescottella equi]|uniref:Scaffolding protein n=1 Tax=Rhodococcus phage REQ3 TaxID=1109714 RepID=G9FH85_9CAUD|nr:hypothetical protein [Prescottella equi]YP_005087230.1 hypothetical protein RoPhREQ3_gp38 [Rhodococcus phage REQ3]AEV51974.1 hypothetical protein [Rhodococcus phage REQ3]ERN43251.1 hypothetical protein H849_24319 [Prescottella equi NBRC 101255 = C 7]ORL29065.1 hypothetical protein A6I89_01920 [Prescottella equi]QPQ77269.1 hypothetical protein I6H09_00045 [Prescottella equi]SUE04880.1 Uncharacterised protein [Prescottella equi]